MSGVTGWFAASRILRDNTPVLEAMTKSLSHRGPGGSRTWVDGPIGLGATSISGGTPDDILPVAQLGSRTLAATFDGQILNREELDQSLPNDIPSVPTSQASIVLRAYLRWGTELVDHLRGSYALAIWDSQAETLLLVRDRLGVKPLYIHETNGDLLFASEIKSLLANPAVPRRVTAEGLREVFEMTKTPGQAVFDTIHELQPGHLLIATPDGIRTRQYWKLEAREHSDDLDSTIAHTRELLDDVIAQQIQGDANLGSMVSGGLDSSLITAIATKLRGNASSLDTFSVDFAQHTAEFIPDPVRGTPDGPFVEELVRTVGTNHHSIVIPSSNMADPDLRTQVVSTLDLPPAFWGDMYPSLYLFFEQVKSRVDVTLSGESADEVFSGYRWFHDPAAIEAETFPWLTSVTGKYFDGKPLFDQSFLKSLSLDQFVKDSYRTALAETPTLASDSAVDKRMREMSYVNLTRFVQSLLDRMDRMSQVHALDVLAPFADHRIIEYAYNIPWELKAFDGREKSILRAATKDVVPKSILERQKSPYPSTQDPSYEKELRNQLRAILDNPNSPVLPLVDQATITDLLKTPLGEVSPMYDRMGTELVVGLNAWLDLYDVEIAL